MSSPLFTDPLDRQISITSTEEVSRLQEWVNIVLEELGHPEAFVTDKSQVEDFDKVPEEIHGIPVTPKTFIIDIAKQIRDKVQPSAIDELF